MKVYPMDVNTNTRVRWEIIKNLPEVKLLNGKRVLDMGAGLGFFSLLWKEKRGGIFKDYWVMRLV